MVRILEAATASLKMNGAPVTFSRSNNAVPSPVPAKAEEILQAEVFADEWHTGQTAASVAGMAKPKEAGSRK